MAEPRELSEPERRLLDELVATGGYDAVLAARVICELKYFPPNLIDEYVTASAWLILARARQTQALRKIQSHAKGLQPHVAQGLLVLWAAMAAEVAEERVKAQVPKQPPGGDDAPPA